MALSAVETDIGDILVQKNLISLEQFAEASLLSDRWRARLVDVLASKRWIGPLAYYKILATYFDMPFVDLTKEPPDRDLIRQEDAGEYLQFLTIPWRKRDGKILIATANPGPETIVYARSKWGRSTELVVTGRLDIVWTVQNQFRDEFAHDAVYELAEVDRAMSARRVISVAQFIFGYLALTVFAGGLVLAPLATLLVLNATMTLFYLGNFVFKIMLVWIGGRDQSRVASVLETLARTLVEDELPVYTVLVPMYNEPAVLPILTGALRELDYPLAKLDIKLVLEEDDHATIDAAKALGLEGIFEIIRVPACQPRTKPKACNYALKFARGDLVVIYDAEDKPERDQLRKVAAAFRSAPANTACIQCRLNYYNANENWLTRLFTLDYSLWFDLMLPGLEKLNIPIPLGGTSNHFRIDVLRSLHAWDPFNVTEDADLGIRLTQKGYRVAVIDSTTFEEANCATGNWIRQRSRWIKGYMQTFLVHTRRPIHLAQTIGPLGVLGFVAFVGGTIMSGLLNPIFWSIFGLWLFASITEFDAVFPPILLYLALFNLLAGNGLFIFLMMIAPFRRGWLDLVPYALTVVWYWVLMSVAAYKGLWQLIFNPFYWEKTDHGISSHTAKELEKALAKQAGMEAKAVT